MRFWFFILLLFISSLILINCDNTSSSNDNNDLINDDGPVLELIGNDTIFLDSGTAYVELGCNAYDEDDGFLKDSVKIGYYYQDRITTLNSTDIGDSVGNYFVKYTIIDSDNNTSSKWRCVIVISTSVKDTTITDTSDTSTNNDTTIIDTSDDSLRYLVLNNILPMQSGDTITITISAFKDSNFTEVASGLDVNVYSSQYSWLSDRTLTTNDLGAAYCRFSYTLPDGIVEESLPLKFYYNDQALITTVLVTKEKTDNKKSMTIAASKGSIYADGISSSDISVTLKDEDFNPLANSVIIFNTTAGSIGSSCTTNSSGVASTKLVSSTVQSFASVTATLQSDNTVTAAISVFIQDSTKTVLSGTIEGASGMLAANVLAYLIPADFNPVTDDSSMLEYTVSDSSGYFRFSAVEDGIYNIQVDESNTLSGGLNKKIETKGKYSIFVSVSMLPYGVLVLNLPDVLTDDDYIYRLGSTYKWKVSDIEKTSTGGYILPNMTSGTFRSINTTSSFLPEITTDVYIYSGDTTVVDIE